MKVAAMDPAEVEFLAEKETVKIIPNFSLDKVYLIGVRRLSGLELLSDHRLVTSLVAELPEAPPAGFNQQLGCVLCLCVVLRATWVLSTPDFRWTSPCGWRST